METRKKVRVPYCSQTRKKRAVESRKETAIVFFSKFAKREDKRNLVINRYLFGPNAPHNPSSKKAYFKCLKRNCNARATIALKDLDNLGKCTVDVKNDHNHRQRFKLRLGNENEDLINEDDGTVLDFTDESKDTSGLDFSSEEPDIAISTHEAESSDSRLDAVQTTASKISFINVNDYDVGLVFFHENDSINEEKGRALEFVNVEQEEITLEVLSQDDPLMIQDDQLTLIGHDQDNNKEKESSEFRAGDQANDMKATNDFEETFLKEMLNTVILSEKEKETFSAFSFDDFNKDDNDEIYRTLTLINCKHGKGVISTTDIQKGAYIGNYYGELCTELPPNAIFSFEITQEKKKQSTQEDRKLFVNAEDRDKRPLLG